MTLLYLILFLKLIKGKECYFPSNLTSYGPWTYYLGQESDKFLLSMQQYAKYSGKCRNSNK